jgi:recombination protein RecA
MEELKKVIDSIEKDMGKGTIMKLGEKQSESIEVISTGSLGLDAALGVNGLPKGRIIEIFGPESSGKTTIAMHVIAEAQKQGGLCAVIDAEHAFDRDYAEKLNIDIEDLYICQPDYGEQGLEVADRLISSGNFSVVVVDSVAALVPKAELEGEMGDSKMGLHARLMSQALRKITAKTYQSNCILIFINQLRDKIGVMFGSPETTTGGNALKFYASIRLDVRRSVTAVNSVMNGEEKIGNQTTVKVIKNKVAPPFKKAEFDIIYGEGIDKAGELLNMAIDKNIIQKSGSWFSYKESKLGQGKETIKQLLKDNPELSEEIKKQI